MPDEKPSDAADRPASLGAHVVPEERLAGIRSHVAVLAQTALAVGDQLPLEADASDLIAVMEAEGA